MKKEDLKFDLVSKNLRTEGKSLVQNGNKDKALRLCTMALFTADSDREKSLALGNRSHVLLEQKQYGAAIEDIQLALKVWLLMSDHQTL